MNSIPGLYKFLLLAAMVPWALAMPVPADSDQAPRKMGTKQLANVPASFLGVPTPTQPLIAQPTSQPSPSQSNAAPNPSSGPAQTIGKISVGGKEYTLLRQSVLDPDVYLIKGDVFQVAKKFATYGTRLGVEKQTAAVAALNREVGQAVSSGPSRIEGQGDQLFAWLILKA